MTVALMLCSSLLLIIMAYIFCRKYIVKSHNRLQTYEVQMEKEIQELRKSPDFFEVDLRNIKENFNLFEGLKCQLASNDEGRVLYPITPIQDLEPNDLA